MCVPAGWKAGAISKEHAPVANQTRPWLASASPLSSAVQRYLLHSTLTAVEASSYSVLVLDFYCTYIATASPISRHTT